MEHFEDDTIPYHTIIAKYRIMVPYHTIIAKYGIMVWYPRCDRESARLPDPSVELP